MAKPERPPARGSLSAYTARRIIRDVTDRGLKVGDALGDESWLIAQYDVSRGTLREALKLLTFLGAITVKAGPRGGPQLTTPGSAVVGSALGMVVQFRGATLQDIFEARTAIEPTAAALAATRRNETDLKQLDRELDQLRTIQSETGPSFARHSERWNMVLAEASHNEVLATMVPAMGAMTATVPFRYTPGMRRELVRRIGLVVTAIREQDSAAALSAHSEMWVWALRELMESQPAKMQARILWPDVDETLAEQRYV